ncbi:MBL fold metallo-hydrolase [Desulfosoma caldarium]|nr:MBL fold metallo-hydrolase [Desulfosoma caldarium]
MALKFQVLASGSKGNAIYVASESTALLVDAGLSAKEVVRRMEGSDLSPRRLAAVLISHEHSDHIRGVGVLSRRFDLPVYLTQATLEGLPSQLGELAAAHIIQSGRTFSVGDLTVHPFALSHDAADPVGYLVEHNGCRLAICTDCGTVTQLVRARLQQCHGLILEANHDVHRLIHGPYAWHLKQRIRSRHGHLSNEECCDLLQEVNHRNLQVVVLAHLSEINNDPRLVRDTLGQKLRREQWHHVRFLIAAQDRTSPLCELNP